MISLVILDVDGVLTSGALDYSSEGNIMRTFHVQDGGAIRLWQSAGGAVAIVSGRSSPAVERRAADLGLEFVAQGVNDKMVAYDEARRRAGASDAETCFIGDDLMDLPPMRRCGYPIAVANAVPTVKRTARYVTRQPGGDGAVRESLEHLMRLNGQWNDAMCKWRSRA